MSDLTARLAEVEERIAAAAARAGRRAGDVQIVAVTKGFPASTVAGAMAGGLRRIGENRAQELLAKARDLGDRRPDEWHFLGRVQRNKVGKLAPLVTVWHSVDRPELGEAVARHAPGARVFVQVNVAGEAQKGGCPPGEAVPLVERLAALGLAVEGLMTVPPLGEDPRPHFAALRELAAGSGVSGLSMGMSADYEVAVEEGATVVRLGSALFSRRSRISRRPRNGTRPR